jgi:hypothetical protein
VKTTVRTAGGGYQGSKALKATQMLSWPEIRYINIKGLIYIYVEMLAGKGSWGVSCLDFILTTYKCIYTYIYMLFTSKAWHGHSSLIWGGTLPSWHSAKCLDPAHLETDQQYIYNLYSFTVRALRYLLIS